MEEEGKDRKGGGGKEVVVKNKEQLFTRSYLARNVKKTS